MHIRYTRCTHKTPTLRKHAYTNILKNLPPKNEIFQIKKSDIFLISAQNIEAVLTSTTIYAFEQK